jgi:hypothetical protein
MARITGCLVAFAILAGSSLPLAQEPAPAVTERPRVEVGIGGSWFFSGGTMPYQTGMIDTRVGVNVSRSWSVEGLVHFMPDTWADVAGYYRAQAVWRIGRASLQPFLAFGGAGDFARYSWPERRYADYTTGEPRVVAAGSRFEISAPFYPTVTIGFEKVLASHLAVRVELTTAFGINDYGIAAAFLPAASVSIPIGRYRAAAR